MLLPPSRVGASAHGRWLCTPRALQARIGRQGLLIGSVLLLQLLLSVLWLSTFQREVHDMEGSAAGGSGGPLSLLRRSSSSSEAGCSAQVLQAIAQLEQLKSEMHGGNSVAMPALASSQPVSATPCISPELCPTLLGSSASPSSAVSDSAPFILIAIPSMPRAADYLSGVLRALDSQLDHDPLSPRYGSIHVWVMNNAARDVSHPVFDANERLYKGRAEFLFLRNDHSLGELSESAGDEMNTGPDIPNPRVQKQTRDIARLMQAAAGKSTYYLAMEDDFELCPHTLRIVEHNLMKAHGLRLAREGGQGGAARSGSEVVPLPPVLTKEWIVIKMGYGFNGLLLHNDGDLEEFSRYLIKHQRRRPPDHLNTEWSCSEKPESRAYVQNRPHLTYRYNLFRHMGTVSSLRAPENEAYPSCFHDMNRMVVFDVDAFDFAGCQHDDLSPCLPREHPQWVPPYGIDQRIVAEENRPK